MPQQMHQRDNPDERPFKNFLMGTACALLLLVMFQRFQYLQVLEPLVVVRSDPSRLQIMVPEFARSFCLKTSEPHSKPIS